MKDDPGNAAVEFVAVVPLLFLVGLTVLQLALLAHAQSVVRAAAAEAARVAAVSADPASARERADQIIADALGDVPISDFRLTTGAVSGLPVVAVVIEARPQLALLPDFVTVTGSSRALREGAAP